MSDCELANTEDWHKSRWPGHWGTILALMALSACDPTALQTKTAPTAPVAERMPEIAGVDHLGRNFSLTEARAKGPVVVIFYRGHW